VVSGGCRPLGGAAPISVFQAVEADELLALPRKPVVLATWSTPMVGPDIHVRVGKTLYSVPWRHIGRRVDARETPTVVQIFDTGQLIATHGRRPVGKATDLSHYPPEKVAFKLRTPTWCRTQAAEIGPSCAGLIASLLEVNALFRLRAAQGDIAFLLGQGRSTPLWAGRFVGQAWEVPIPFGAGDRGAGDVAEVGGDPLDVGVPQSDGVIQAGGGQGVAVGAERREIDGVGVAGEGGQLARVTNVGYVPQPSRLVGACGS
jgi:Mu transposase-like protein